MPKTMPSFWEEVTVADVVSNAFVETATLLFVFFLGAAVGSFVNVILYRMPRRINLLWPPSRCPACLHRLKLIDNLPVVGWVRLRGKCRHCGAAIPRSYLRVEVGFGLLFLALLYVEIHTGGSNLPLRAPNSSYPGALWNLWYPKPDLVRIWVYHLPLVGVLGTLVLFARRGERFPGLFVLAALAAAILPTVWHVGLHQVPWAGAGARAESAWRLTGPAEAVLGLAAGLALGAVLGALLPPRAAIQSEAAWLAVPPRWDAVVLLAVAGTWLGWQAAVAVAVLTAGFAVAKPRASSAALVAVAVAVQLVGWRLTAQLAPWWPGPHTPHFASAGWVVAAAALALVARRRAARLPPLTAETPPAGSSLAPEPPHTAPATPPADSTAAGREANA